jgi:hypothetical protein
LAQAKIAVFQQFMRGWIVSEWNRFIPRQRNGRFYLP